MFIDPAETLRACNLQITDSVADFGAGSGFVASAAAKLVPRGNVFAIELQRDMVTRIAREATERHLSNLHALWGDVEIENGSTLKTDSMDVVILSNILFQLDDKAGAFKEAFRVLKKGGKLIVVDWTESFGGLGPAPHHVFQKAQAEALASQIGFTKKSDTLPGGEHHYAILFEK